VESHVGRQSGGSGMVMKRSAFDRFVVGRKTDSIKGGLYVYEQDSYIDTAWVNVNKERNLIASPYVVS